MVFQKTGKEEHKDKSKEKFFKKQKVLESLNQDSLELESAVTDLSHNSHEEADNSKDNNVDNNNSNMHSMKLMNKSQRMQTHNHHKRRNDSTLIIASSKDKKVLKCRVDQMEYLKQIFKNQKLKNNNYVIGDSFRQTTSPNKNKKPHSYNIDSKLKQVNDDEGNYLFSYQPNKKEKQKELRKYMKTKRVHERQNQEQKEFEKNTARRLTIMYISIKYIRHSAILSVWSIYL